MTAFASIGWTGDQWVSMFESYTQAGTDGLSSPVDRTGARHNDAQAFVVTYWLQHPPAVFHTPINPADVHALFARHGPRTGRVLNGIAAGASERFVTTFLNHATPAQAPEHAWQYASTIRLTEPEATGWAATGYLGASHSDGLSCLPRSWDLAGIIKGWIARFGPTAYLWILAGFTWNEAVALDRSGDLPSGADLRVMAVLNGAILPAGV